MKTCTKCGETKSLDQFQRNAQNKTDGRRPDCKVCNEACHRLYRAQPHVKVRISAYMKNYKKKMPPEQATRDEACRQRYYKKSPRHALTLARTHALMRRPTPGAISVNELMDIWRAQDGRCALSRVEMTWRQGSILPTSISIDRIDGDGGYEPTNVRLVCYAVNAFRNRMTDEQMFAMALALVTNMRKPRLRIVS